MTLTIEEGRGVVALARSTLESFVREGKREAKVWASGLLAEKRGVFVTLNSEEMGEVRLRGCIGFPYPVKPLGEAVQEATVAAAAEDPRFPPVQVGELDSILVEVSVLTVPEQVMIPRRQELPSKVKVGRDGLIVSRGYASGLLLPQVAVEHNMDSEEFLSQTCMKAGLPPDSWLDKGTVVQLFQAEVFSEARPRGEAVRSKI